MVELGARRAGAGYRPASTSLASAASIGRPVSEWKATTRISAPSSARALVVMRSRDRVQRALVGELDAVVLDALAQDRQARREVGRREVGDQAGLEALAQAGLERVHVAPAGGRR